MGKDLKFTAAKKTVLENLDALQASLSLCVDEGMIDEHEAYYNELLGLIDEILYCKQWDELMEVVAKAKTLEVDIASWLSRQGQTSLSYPWPHP